MLDDKCTLGLLMKLRFYSDLYSKNSILTPTLVLNTWMEEEMLPVFREAINIPMMSSEAECCQLPFNFQFCRDQILDSHAAFYEPTYFSVPTDPLCGWAGSALQGPGWLRLISCPALQVVLMIGRHISCVAGAQPVCCSGFPEHARTQEFIIHYHSMWLYD